MDTATLPFALPGAPDLQPKCEAALRRISDLGRAVVAYSGGVDSTLALKLAHLALGERCEGVIAKSETLTGEDFHLALEIAEAHGIPVRVVEYSELEIENYAANPVNRCYFCKRELHTRLGTIAREAGAVILDGLNLDDEGDYRPGAQAALELGVVSPLRDAGFSKEEVRRAARALGLSNWDKPSMPCLASRVPYGEPIDEVKLRQIAEGESLLRRLGFRQARLRHHGATARLEVEPGEIVRLAAEPVRGETLRGLRALGFQYVALDLAGYRTGSLNEAIALPAADRNGRG